MRYRFEANDQADSKTTRTGAIRQVLAEKRGLKDEPEIFVSKGNNTENTQGLSDWGVESQLNMDGWFHQHQHGGLNTRFSGSGHGEAVLLWFKHTPKIFGPN